MHTRHSMPWTRVRRTRTTLARSWAGPSVSLTCSLLVEAGRKGPHVPHILTWRVLRGWPCTGPDAGSTDTFTCAKHSHTRTEQGTPAITPTDVLPRTHSSYKDDGKGTLNPLTRHWEEHIYFIKYERNVPSGEWKIFYHEEPLPLSKQRAKCSREVLGK